MVLGGGGGGDGAGRVQGLYLIHKCLKKSEAQRLCLVVLKACEELTVLTMSVN